MQRASPDLARELSLTCAEPRLGDDLSNPSEHYCYRLEWRQKRNCSELANSIHANLLNGKVLLERIVGGQRENLRSALASLSRMLWPSNGLGYHRTAVHRFQR